MNSRSRKMLDMVLKKDKKTSSQKKNETESADQRNDELLVSNSEHFHKNLINQINCKERSKIDEWIETDSLCNSDCTKISDSESSETDNNNDSYLDGQNDPELFSNKESYFNCQKSPAKVLKNDKVEIEETTNYELPIDSFISDDSLSNNKDTDFLPSEFSSETNSSSDFTSSIPDSFPPKFNSVDIDQSQAEILKIHKNKLKKVIRCIYCEKDIDNKNFMRHIERNHFNEKEVLEILKLPKKSKERRKAYAALINNTNFNLYISGITRPKRKPKDINSETVYYPCAFCKGIFTKQYLRRHAKICSYQQNNPESRIDYVSCSHTITACAMDPTKTISKLNVKEQVFDKMKGDEVAFVVKKDPLIAHFGETYLKKHRRERMTYVCSNRMRELARLLIEYRKVTNTSDVSMKNLIDPKNFDSVVHSARNIVGYDYEKKTFKAPSLAIHLGTSLKSICDELTHLFLKQSRGFSFQTESEKSISLQNVKNFKKLVEFRWNSEIASLANKDLQEKRWHKPKLMPLVSDVKKFRDNCLKTCSDCVETLSKENNKNAYRTLVQCTLALLILFNRRRIGDVQFLKICDYRKTMTTSFKDFENALTETEKLLTKKYRRVVNSGKGSREVVILIPEVLDKFVKILLEHRRNYIASDNEYVFAVPGSRIKWGKGDVAFRELTKKMDLENPQAITSNKLRKQIATVTQILSLSKEESKQFSNFMGHTEKTHKEFYELPIDIYQTAKVSKLLLMMEKGTIPLEYKGKSLNDIDLEPDLHFPEENEVEDDGADAVSDMTAENITDVEGMIEKNKKRLSESQTLCHKLQKKSKPTTVQKKSWSSNEVKKLSEKFSDFIKNKSYPSSKEIGKFIEENNIKRSVQVVKSKLQHLMKCS